MDSFEEPQPLIQKLTPQIIHLLSHSFITKLEEFLKEEKKKKENSELLNFPESSFYSERIKTLKIQTTWRMKRISRRFKIRQKKLKHRGYIIKELISSETNYCKSLEMVANNILKPAEHNEMLSKDEIHKLFSHLINIMHFSKALSEELSERMNSSSFDIKRTCFLDIFLRHAEFFKIYSPYCNNFPDAQNFLLSIRENTKHKFTQLLKKLEYSSMLGNLNLLDHLIKPIQRLPKYELIFKDLKKNTEVNHPDYENIAKALETYTNINKENNKKMEIYLKQLRLFDLQKNFGSKSLNLFDRHRSFLREESLFVIKEEFPYPIILYILSDLLLITEINESGQSSLTMQMKLGEDSFVCDLQNTRSYKWLFSVYGVNGGVVFHTDNKEHKIELMKFIESTISSIRTRLVKITSKELLNKWKFSLRINTIGTIRRGVKSFKPYTLYVIEVKLEKRQFRLYLRFSELIDLEEVIKQKIPGIELPHFAKTLSNFLMSQQLKIIESRKLMIENFLQILLQNGELLNGDKAIFKLLGLPANFFEINLDHEAFLLDDAEIQENKIFLGEESLFYQFFNNFYKKKLLLKISNLEKPVEIKVRLIDNTEIPMKVDYYTKCLEVCKQISKKIGLKSWLDFKLFMYNTKTQEEFYLDDEEFLLKALEFIEEKETTLLSKISLNLKKIKKIITGADYVIMFKKHGFFSYEFEEKEFKKDTKRLNLIFVQYFSEVYSGKYSLNLMEYMIVASIKLYTIYHRTPKDFKLLSKIIKEVLPLNIFNNKKVKIEETLLYFWQEITKQIDETQCDRSGDFIKTRTNEIDIAKSMLISFLRKEKLFGSLMFWVSLIKKEKTDVKDSPDYVWLVLKYSTLSIMHPNEKSVFLKEFPLENIEEYAIYPNHLKIKLKTGQKYRFSMNRSFEFGQIISKYIELQKINDN